MSGEQGSPEHITLPPGDYFRVIEERRRAAETVLWQLSGISLAAQAFLLSAGLDSNAEPCSQVVVGVLGIGAVIGTGLIILYQVVRANIFECWLSQTARLPLGPDELAIQSLKLSRGRICLMKSVFWLFYGVCLCALLALLAADVYVLGLGAKWW